MQLLGTNGGIERDKRGRRDRHGVSAVLLAILFSMSVGFIGVVDAQAMQYATSLEIDQECEYAAIVTVRDAWPEAPPLRYALVDRGDPRPSGDEFDAVLDVPVERVVSLSSTVIPHVVDLGMVDRLVGVDAGSYIYDEMVHRRVVNGSIEEVGSAESFDLERLVAVRPDVVVTSAMGPDDPTVRRISAAGIPVLILADWRSRNLLVGPSGFAFWAALSARRSGGASLCRTGGSIRSCRGSDSGYPERRAAVSPGKRAMAGDMADPRGDSYIATLFADAGGRYLWADRPGAGSNFLDLEAVLQRGATADYWFNLNFGWRTREDARDLDPRLAAFRAFQERRMYHYIRRVQPWGANDFWESGAARPDLVLADLVRILHPEVLPEHQLVYYRRLD